MNAPRILFIVLAVLTTAIWRLVPHAFNVVPMHALAVWGGACLFDRRRGWTWLLACALPLAAQLASDIIIERTRSGIDYPVMMMACVYLSLLASFAIGWLVNGRWSERTTGPLWIAGAGVASWAVFFLLTNYADWLYMPTYPKTLAGLIDCYIAGWLFDSGKSLIGNLVFQGILFGVWAALPSREVEASQVAQAAN